MRYRLMKTSCGVVAALLLCADAHPARAQEAAGEPPKPDASAQSAAPAPSPWDSLKFGATLEGFYEYNWNQPPDRVNLLHAYDTRANTFGIQQVALVVDSPPKVDDGRRFGVRVDLQWGQATETVQGGSANEPRPDVYRNIWQAYGTYVFPVGRGLQTDFGKFASNLGYETNYVKDNQAFSRAYLFNFLPFYHSGLRATLPVSDSVTVMYMLTNGIQQTEDFNDFKSNHVAAIIKPAASVTWTVNYFFGQEQADNGSATGPDGFFRVFDTYVTVNANAKTTLGLDVNHTTNEVTSSGPSLALTGVGAYARYQVTAPAAFGLRYEYLDDEGLFGGINQVLQEVTLTAEYKFAEGFLMRGEFRRDWSNEDFFPGPAIGEKLTHQNTALIGLVWWVGNKTGAW